MSIVALLKIRLLFLLIIYSLFTDGWRIEKTTAENDDLNKKLCGLEKKMTTMTMKYETVCKSTIEPV